MINVFVKVCYCGHMNLCSKHDCDDKEQTVQSTVNIYHMTKYYKNCTHAVY